MTRRYKAKSGVVDVIGVALEREWQRQIAETQHPAQRRTQHPGIKVPSIRIEFESERNTGRDGQRQQVSVSVPHERDMQLERCTPDQKLRKEHIQMERGTVVKVDLDLGPVDQFRHRVSVAVSTFFGETAA